MVRWQMSEARRDFSTLVERASRGEWQLVGRRARAEVVLADAAEISALLAAAFPFAPDVFIEDESVGIYLNELDVHGVGATLEEAQEDLIDAVLEYVDDWQDDLRSAPNHRQRAGFVRRLELARDRADAHLILFAEKPDGASEK
jgi:prevent-host-death family protein